MSEFYVLDEAPSFYLVYRVVERVLVEIRHFATREQAEAYIEENEACIG